MDAPAPPPLAPFPAPSPQPAAPTPAGPYCTACADTAAVHWRRRPTDTEVAEVVAVEAERRAALRLHADPMFGPPGVGPLPTADDMTHTVYACATHAITLDAAALIHQSTCTAPDPAVLPGCNCTPQTPEPAPPADTVPANPLPDHWITGA